MTQLTPLQPVEELSSRVIRILGCNAGPMTLQGTNSYLVGKGSKRILIDTTENIPNTIDYLNNLKKELEARECSIQEILITHWHIDHIGAVQNIFKSITQGPVKVSKHRMRDKPEPYQVADFNFINDNDEIKTQGATLRAIYTPGHTEDHLSFYLEEENAIFSGDCILGETSAEFEDLYDYMNSLKKLKSFNAELIYPGHGPLIKNGIERINEYIAHRTCRNEQIIETLKSSKQSMTAQELVTKIYLGIDENLFIAATINVNNHLNALKKENIVVQVDDEHWIYNDLKPKL